MLQAMMLLGNFPSNQMALMYYTIPPALFVLEGEGTLFHFYFLLPLEM